MAREPKHDAAYPVVFLKVDRDSRKVKKRKGRQSRLWVRELHAKTKVGYFTTSETLAHTAHLSHYGRLINCSSFTLFTLLTPLR